MGSKFYLNIVVGIILSSFMLVSCTNIDVQTLNTKATFLMQQGDVDGAIARLESINDLNPNLPQNHYNLGVAYYKKQNYEKALNSLQNATKLDHKYTQAYNTIAIIHENIVTDAEDEFEQLKKTKSRTKKIKEQELELIIKITNNLQKAIFAYTSYAEYTDDKEKKKSTKNLIEELKQDILNYNKEIKKYAQ